MAPRWLVEMGLLFACVGLAGLALAAAQAFFGWSTEAVGWGLVAIMVAVLAYAGFAAYGYFRALREEDDDL